MKWRILKWLIPLLFLTPVVWQAVFDNSVLKVDTNFSKSTPYFSRFLPEGRVDIATMPVQVKIEPVYFDLLLPPRTSSANISLKVNMLPDNLQLGVRQGPGWDYVFPEQKLVNGERVIAVNNFPYIPNHYLRILVSAPDSGGQLVVEKATAYMYRQRFNFHYASELFDRMNKSFVEKIWNPTVNIIKPRYEESGAITTD